MTTKIYIMATPVEPPAPVDGPTITGTASEVCRRLWGKTASGAPRYISQVLCLAREGEVYRGYLLGALPHQPNPSIIYVDEYRYPTNTLPMGVINEEDVVCR